MKFVGKELNVAVVVVNFGRQILLLLVARPILRLEYQLSAGSQLIEHPFECHLEAGIAEIQVYPFGHR